MFHVEMTKEAVKMNPSDSMPPSLEHFASLVEPIADDFGVELVDIESLQGVVRVVIDEPDGLNSQTLVDVTKAISRMVDAEDPISGRFTLEVSSPGVERPLKQPTHFRRAIGEAVSIKTMPEVDGDRRVEGKLTAADDEGITVTGDHGTRTLRYGEIRTARTTFEWGPGPKPGGKKNGASKGQSTNKGKVGSS